MRYRPKRENFRNWDGCDEHYIETLNRYCTYLENKIKQLTIPVVVKSFYCLSDPKEGGLKRCEKQCKGCEMSKYNKQ